MAHGSLIIHGVTYHDNMLYGIVKELYCHVMEHDTLVYASHATKVDGHLDIHNAMHHIISHMMCVRDWIKMYLLKIEISVSHLLRFTHSYSYHIDCG
jgi:hypothetical protein